MLLLNGKSDDASRVMVELLGTYTTENASQAREEAQRCIIASLAGKHFTLFHFDLINVFNSQVDLILFCCSHFENSFTT